jgi:redox-sensitive bicupin YhaK (pirin superfamily)
VSDCRNKDVQTPVAVTQDVNAFASELEEGQSVTHELAADRQAYLLCIEGGVTVNGNVLQRHDACEITGGGPVEIVATETEETEHGNVAHILMFTMAKQAGSGRTDL